MLGHAGSFGALGRSIRLAFVLCAVSCSLAVPLSIGGAEPGERGLFKANAVAPIFEPAMTIPVGGMCFIDIVGIPLDKLDFVIIGGEYRFDGKQVIFVPKNPIGRVLLDARTQSAMLFIPTNDELRGVYHVVQTGGEALRIRPVTIGTGTRPVDTPVDPPIDPPVDPLPPTTKVSATYIYEKDQHAVPTFVMSALNRLNRERKIFATAMEADTVDGNGDVPDFLKVPLAAAKQKGLPCLVVTAGDKVLAIVKPKTEAEILKAVP